MLKQINSYKILTVFAVVKWRYWPVSVSSR